ncbi:uncharacterized protein LOC103041179 isoform X1 [Astyanax mexicanus]|uniref:uncharacterized protein LOC103041179 isoform X1 n=2 Tax=Astyanax mexicanus TaxID=7994 RepID=UPI0020CAEAB4|nr:uncharacterized protein LOC103041179 isoform X1 [Astyanax mexicanus]
MLLFLARGMLVEGAFTDGGTDFLPQAETTGTPAHRFSELSPLSSPPYEMFQTSKRMLNTEALWNNSLTDNNVKDIFCWLRCIITEDKDNAKNSLANFNCWLQCSLEMTKKELLTLCFVQRKGLWMCLDQRAFTKVHLLTQKLENLLSLSCLGKKLTDPHLSTHRLTNGTYLIDGHMISWGCSNQEQQILRQHILLGRLVQWWSLTGLLPQYPDACEFKQISQMWRKMDQNPRRVCLKLRCDIEDKYRSSSLIQDIMARLVKQHGPLWVSEDCAYQTYPPPSLNALLNLVLVPHVDITCVQAIIMYFVLDVSNYLRCNDDLLKSFCRTFSIPPSFSQQIRGFWLMDHGFVSDSMEMLLSPKASSPWLSLHHWAVLRTLLKRGERQAALKYLYYTTPAIESVQNARLYMDVLLQNNRVSEAWMLLRHGQLGNKHLLKHFIHECENVCVCGEALTAVCKKLQPHLPERPDSVRPEATNQDNIKHELNSPEGKDQTSRPLSALLYKCLSNSSLTPEDLITHLRQTVTDLNSLQTTERVLVVWPEHLEITEENRNIHPTHPACHNLPDTPDPAELQKAPQRSPELEQLEDELPALLQLVCVSPSVESSGTTSPDSITSACSFTTAPSSPLVVPSETPSAIYSSTETVQSPFSTCTQEDCQVLDNELRAPENLAQICCPDLTLTVDGSTEAMPFKSLRRGSAIELDIYECVVEISTSAVPENISDPTDSPIVETAQTKKRSKSKFNLPSQCYSNEDNQAVHSPAELPVDSHNFLTPDYEKAVYDKVVSEDIIKAENVTESLTSEQKAESFYPQESFSIETPETSSFLELEPLRRALSLPLAEEGFEVSRSDSQDSVDQPEILTSCAPSEDMQDLEKKYVLKKRGDPCQSASLASLRSAVIETDFFTHQLHIPLGVSVSPCTSPTRSPQLSPSDQVRDKSPSQGKTTTAKVAMCFRTTPDGIGHCRVGSWWKQGLETRRASTGLLHAVEQVSAATKGQSQSRGSPGLLESSAKPKGGKKEVRRGGKEESTSRRGPRKVASHPVESGSSAHAERRDKRGKRFKQS